MSLKQQLSECWFANAEKTVIREVDGDTYSWIYLDTKSMEAGNKKIVLWLVFSDILYIYFDLPN